MEGEVKTCLMCDRFRHNSLSLVERHFWCVKKLIHVAIEPLTEGPLHPATLIGFQFAEICPYFDEIASFKWRRESMEKKLLVRFE